MPRFLMALTVAGLAFTSGLTSCAPTVRPPQTQVLSSVRVDGNLIAVTLTNAGPRDLLRQNTCPRPFALSLTDQADQSRQVKFTPLDICTAPELPPVLWRVGEAVSAQVEFPLVGLVGSTRALSAQAAVKVKLASDGEKVPFRMVRVNVAPFTVTVQ